MADIYNPEETEIDDSVLNAYEKVEIADESVSNIEKEFSKDMPDTTMNMCAVVEYTTKWGGYVTKLGDTAANLSGTISMSPEVANTPAGQIVLKSVEKLILKIKRIVLKIKLKIAQWGKKMLLSRINGNGSTMLDPISITVIALFTALGTAINAVILTIDILMKLITVTPIAVMAGGMSFFLTPKSFKKTDINVLNPNQMIGDRFPDAIKRIIHEAGKVVAIANKVIKLAAIAAGAAAGAIAIMGKTNDFQFGICKAMERLDPGKVYKAIEIIKDLIPIPLGLPRYEKLKFTNLGFMAFLLTGFELAAHQSFGIPGQY